MQGKIFLKKSILMLLFLMLTLLPLQVYASEVNDENIETIIPEPTAVPTPTATPRPTATPTPTMTPAPTATPTPTPIPVYKVTVVYNKNNGTGTMTNQVVKSNAAVNLKKNTFTRSGYQFIGWNTKADGSGIAVKDQEAARKFATKARNGKNLTLYAMWKKEVYKVTFAFNRNGGSGTMTNQVVISNAASNLKKNAFTRTGFTFNGWNTKADGTGTSLKNQAAVKSYATKARNNTKITLYAMWKVKGVSLKTVSSSTPTSIKITYAQNTKATGYQIQYAKNSKFTNAKKVTAGASTSTKTLTNLTRNATYYIRIRTYYTKGAYSTYSAWSSYKMCTLSGSYTIANVASEASIEADITLSGSGTGYHAKMVICTATSAISYGIQFDECGAPPYTGKAMAMVENVISNNPGGQEYFRPGNHELVLGKTYHMMLTIKKDGHGSLYLNYQKIGDFYNPALANQTLYLRVEGSARLNGDKVKANFKNIKLKNYGTYDPDKYWGTYEFKTNQTINSTITSNTNITISGTVSGLGPNGDWDSQYAEVSDIIQFVG